jgi:hypothetical protein
VPYEWVLELGELNGRIHYHAVVWVPEGMMLPKPDKAGWWVKGSTTIERARNQDAVKGYLQKYLAKGSADKGAGYPRGARIFGHGGLGVVDRLRMAWGRCPAYVREFWPDYQDEPRPAPGGGWVSRATGQVLKSSFMFVGLTALGMAVVRRVPEVVDLCASVVCHG